MQVENIFPNPILQFSVISELTDHSLTIAKKYANDEGWFKSEHYGRSLTSYHSDTDVNYLGKYDINLCTEIIKVARTYLDGIGWYKDVDLIIESWLNLNLYGTGHGTHEHYNSLISGVVWLQTNKDSEADFVFVDPIGVKTQSFLQYKKYKIKDTDFNINRYNISPKSGDGIIFPSWMPHQVLPNKLKEHRYSVAFNIWIDKNGKN